jgi:hypothetical protein
MRIGNGWTATGCLVLALGLTTAAAQTSDPKAGAVKARASGTFEVVLTPQEGAQADSAATTLGRMSSNKEFKGDLQGWSRGQMLTAVTSVKGSAGYVAIERVQGTLQGRSGTFVLQHMGVMNRGEQSLSITVVPDSGTEGLAGITGTMNIVIAPGGQHSYEFDYTLPPAAP